LLSSGIDSRTAATDSGTDAGSSVDTGAVTGAGSRIVTAFVGVAGRTTFSTTFGLQHTEGRIHTSFRAGTATFGLQHTEVRVDTSFTGETTCSTAFGLQHTAKRENILLSINTMFYLS